MINIKGVLVRNLANPTLGPGRIKGSDNLGRLTIELLWHGTSYAIDPSNISIERYVLFGLAPVRFMAHNSVGFCEGYVVKSLTPDSKGLWNYAVKVKNGDQWTTTSIPESDLIPLPPGTNLPMDHLRTLA